MPYATQQHLTDRFGLEELVELSDRADPPTGEIDGTVVGGALADADGVINSYIARRYPLPLDDIPAVLTRIACDLARYYLHDEAPPDRVKHARDQAVSFLKDLSANRASLDIADTEPPVTENIPRVSGPERTFSHDTLREF